MPIVLARVDNRLVHGQILSAWLPRLAADALLVLDDEAARNTLVRSAMEIAIPPELQFEVAPVAQANHALGRIPAASRTVVLLRDVNDAIRAIDDGLPIRSLNLGNVHHSHERHPVTASVYLSVDELEALSELVRNGVDVELRTLPGEQPMPLEAIQRRLDGGSR